MKISPSSINRSRGVVGLNIIVPCLLFLYPYFVVFSLLFYIFEDSESFSLSPSTKLILSHSLVQFTHHSLFLYACSNLCSSVGSLSNISNAIDFFSTAYYLIVKGYTSFIVLKLVRRSFCLLLLCKLAERYSLVVGEQGSSMSLSYISPDSILRALYFQIDRR